MRTTNANINLDGLTPYLLGSSSEVELYNRALSASEIQAIFNAGSAGKFIPPL